MIYLDYTATTPIDKDVLKTYIHVQNEFYANVDSLHRLGQRSKFLYEKTITDLKELLEIKDHKLIFTGSATIANNLAILGTVRKYKKGNIITSKIEHPSVYSTFNQLQEEGFQVNYLDVNPQGVISLQQLESYLNNDTVLVSIMWVNNIIGSIQPIYEIIKLVKRFPKVRLHVDCVQGMCKLTPDFPLNEIDFLVLNAHKTYGPKGIGMLALKDNIELKKIFHGSKAQFNIYPGTIDLAAIAALYKTYKKFLPATKEHYKIVGGLNNYIRENIKGIPHIVENSDKYCSPYIYNISIPGHQGETIVHHLGEQGIFVSTGSACSSKQRFPERTIMNISNSEKRALSSIRISLSHLTTYSEIDNLIINLRQVKGNV